MDLPVPEVGTRVYLVPELGKKDGGARELAFSWPVAQKNTGIRELKRAREREKKRRNTYAYVCACRERDGYKRNKFFILSNCMNRGGGGRGRQKGREKKSTVTGFKQIFVKLKKYYDFKNIRVTCYHRICFKHIKSSISG